MNEQIIIIKTYIMVKFQNTGEKETWEDKGTGLILDFSITTLEDRRQ